MTHDSKPATRRTILIAAAALTSLPLLAHPGKARAAGTMPKANVKYQETPKNGKSCATCNYFIAGKPGACKVVAGPISPNAWCMMFAPKA